MWVYQNSEPGLFTVGFYKPSGQWEPESDWSSRDQAAERTRYLNGGSITVIGNNNQVNPPNPPPDFLQPEDR